MKVRKSLKNFFKSFLCYVLIVATLINTGFTLPTFAKVIIPSGRDDEFGENNIVFYNPDGKKSDRKNGCITGGNCNFKGETKDEKLWSGLRSYGFTPEQTAALLGNFSREGGSPTRQENAYNTARDKGCKTMEGNPYTVWTGPDEHHSSCMQGVYSHYSAGKKVQGIGLGFAQWTSQGRREPYLNTMKSLGLYDKFFDGDAYKEWGRLSDDELKSKASEDEYSALWCAALKFVHDEIFEGSYSDFLNKTGVENIAEYTAVVYEACNGCTSGSTETNARIEAAKGFYQDYLNGKFDSVDPGDSGGSGGSGGSDESGGSGGSGGSSSEDGSNVLIIGDSITVRSESEIKALMPSVNINAEVSRGFDAGISILEGMTDIPDIIVFALGTNTDNVKKADAEKVIAKAGDKKVIFVTNYSLGAHDYTGNNAVFNSLKSGNVLVADWAGAVSSDPTKYIANEGGSMDVHPTIPEGTKLFAKTIYQAITNKSGTCGNYGDNPTVTIEDGEYTFPIAGATKANVLNGKNSAGRSDLSPLPCSNYTGCHHDSPAVDTGIRMNPSRASEYGGSESDYMYYSAGAQTVALTSGTITSYSSGYNGHPECASISFKGDDGRNYWIGHTLYDSKIKKGDHFEVGQHMTLVGPPKCALNTQSHIHVNTTKEGGSCTRSNRSGCTNDAIDIINKTFEALPEN